MLLCEPILEQAKKAQEQQQKSGQAQNPDIPMKAIMRCVHTYPIDKKYCWPCICNELAAEGYEIC